MKILFLNPHIDAEHGVVKALKKRGFAVLFPENADEAWANLKLHGSSVDLAIIHREGNSKAELEAGVRLVTKIKSDSEQADLPVVLSSQLWGDADFASHQQTASGANAYLKWPYSEAQLLQVIDAMFGDGQSNDVPSLPPSGAGKSGSIALEMDTSAPSLEIETSSAPKSTPKSAPKPAPKKAPPPPAPSRVESGTKSVGLVLEDASVLFARPDTMERSDTSIRLEAPEFEKSTQTSTDSTPALEAPAEPTGGIALAMPTEEAAAPPSGPPSLALPTQEDSGSPTMMLPPAAEAIEAPAEIPLAAAPPPPAGAEISMPTAGTSQGIPLTSGTALDLNIPEADSNSIGMPMATPAELLDGPAAGGDEPGFDLDAEISTAATGTAAISLGADEPPAPEEFDPSATMTMASAAAYEAAQEDAEAAQEMPYLFKGKGGAPSPGMSSAMAFAQPLGDAVVPGGAAHSPDEETLKKYLLLREQDVAVLSTQLKATKDQVAQLEGLLRDERARNVELDHTVNEQKRKIDDFDRDKAIALESLQTEINDLRFQVKARTDKARILEAQVREATEEMERLKERVRADIRKIRVREKELENRLEIMKKDSEALIGARENKIIELKRKLDLLEFNMDLLQDQFSREKENSAKLRERLGKAAQVVRVAGGLLDSKTAAGLGLEEDPEKEAS